MGCSTIKGNQEPYLFKTFKEKNQANDFINKGAFRLGHICTYKKIEDASRKDEEEGKSHYKKRSDSATLNVLEHADGSSDCNYTHGEQNCYDETPQSIYLFCCSAPTVNPNLLDKFGKYTVRINQPQNLIRDLNNFFQQNKEIKIVGKAHLVEVRYDKGTTLPDPDDPIKLIYSQKPAKFKEEREWRFVIMLDYKCHFKEDFLPVNLNKKLDYLEIEKT